MDTMKETIQQTCRACDQVITLSKPRPEVEYCLRCTEEIDSWHHTHAPTEDELDCWADLWESQDKR